MIRAIVDFALAHGMKVKGHTLVWYAQLPGWVSSITTADDLRTAMNDHITQVMTHFKGKVTAWDVVNEAWIDGTTMQPSPFLDLLGPGYVDEAFITGTTREITPVTTIDGRPVGTGRPGPITMRLLAHLRERIVTLSPSN